MLKFSRILFPVAFSERCRGAARYAGALSCHFHAELVLLHVVAPPPSVFGGPEAVAYPADLFDGMLDKSKTDLEAFPSEELQGLNVTRVVLEGDPARTIIQYAHAERFDLIVMPTHGYGPFRRFLLGSVTAKVLHDADCPVWTGPHMEQAPARESLSLRHIVCAVDLGPQSQAIVDWAVGMADEFKSDVAFVHAIPSSLAGMGDVYLDSQWCVRVASAARERILCLQEAAGSKGEIYIEEGDAPFAVSEAARRLHADLLVIGRGSDSGLVGRLRANAYAILRESPCAVVSI